MYAQTPTFPVILRLLLPRIPHPTTNSERAQPGRSPRRSRRTARCRSCDIDSVLPHNTTYQAVLCVMAQPPVSYLAIILTTCKVYRSIKWPIFPQRTSQVHRRFVREPIGNKGVQALAGVGRVIGGAMAAGGIVRADQVLGRYLVLNKDEATFKKWVRGFGANAGQQQSCYNCIRGWCTQHL